jgi:hypothetical protein
MKPDLDEVPDVTLPAEQIGLPEAEPELLEPLEPDDTTGGKELPKKLEDIDYIEDENL